MTISDKIRIYELSRDLNLDNKDILDAAQKLSISVKSHSSSISAEEAKKIKNLINKKNSDKKIKLLENIKNSVNLVKRNYLLMQLHKVDIPGHVKLKVQEAVHRKIPQLIKHRFQVMFLQDKLSNQIKNLDSWIMEFTRLSRFRGLDDK